MSKETTAIDGQSNVQVVGGWCQNKHRFKTSVEFYDAEAATYEHRMQSQGFNGPSNTMPLCLAYLKKDGRILDFGSGTGTIGKMLQDEGFKDLHAMDPSAEMLAIAKNRNIYKSFHEVYLEPNTIPGLGKQSYDGIVHVGVLAPGQMTPADFSLLIQLVKPGGRIVFGARELFMHNLTQQGFPEWDWDGYAMLEELVTDGKIKILHKEIKPNHFGDQPGIYCAFEVC